MTHQPNSIVAGTQVVTLLEIRGLGNSLVHPCGTVGVVTRTPCATETHFLVRFPDGYESFRLPLIPDLVARKLGRPEQSQLADADLAFHEVEYQRLRAELQAAHESSRLPESPSPETRAAINDLLVRLRLRGRDATGK